MNLHNRSGLNDLRALEVFASVAEAGSMTAGAQRLGLSQSGVSQSIRQLETALGAALIDRGVRPLALTRAGAELHRQARQLLAQAGQVAQSVRRSAHVGERQLRIGLVDSLAVSVGADLARQLRAEGSSCQLHSGQSLGHVEALRRRELDLVIGSDSALIEHPELAVRPLFAEPLMLALPGDYQPRDITLDQVVADLELVAYSEDAAIARQTALHFSRLRLEPRCRLAFDSTDVVFRMVGEGLGFAVTTPLCLLQGRNQLKRVRIAALPGPVVRRHLSIGFHTGEFDDLALDVARISAQALRRDAFPAIRQIDSNSLHDCWLTQANDG
jgi:DNA-binding transcriptional LysR family regulator